MRIPADDCLQILQTNEVVASRGQLQTERFILSYWWGVAATGLGVGRLSKGLRVSDVGVSMSLDSLHPQNLESAHSR